MNQMKKHPVDDFFAERLADHQAVPSPRAFDKFQERLAEREKKAMPFLGIRPKSWYYYGAAASVALLMTIGYLQYNGDVKPGDQLARSTPATQDAGRPVQSVQTEAPRQEPEKIQPSGLLAQAETVSPVYSTHRSTSAATSAKSTESVPVTVTAPEVPEAVIPAQNQLAINVEKVEARKIADLQESTTGKMERNAGETVVYITSIPDPQEITGSVKSGGNTLAMNSAEEEKSVFSRVFGEIRNLKHGEKVDLARLGLKSSDKELAREEGFIASETRQIREGWQWIKGKINNN